MNISQEIRALGLSEGQFIVVGGGCLAIRGLRETRDLDIVVLPEVFNALQKQGWPLDPGYEQRWNRQRLKRGEIEIYPDMFLEVSGVFIDVKNMIRHAEMIDGIPFLSLKDLRLFKSGASREKDLQDLVLIDDFLKRTDAHDSYSSSLDHPDDSHTVMERGIEGGEKESQTPAL